MNKNKRILKKGDKHMGAVLHLYDYKTKNNDYSILDMFDTKKREEIYAYYDDRYEETEEEEDILKIMTSRRRGE